MSRLMKLLEEINNELELTESPILNGVARISKMGSGLPGSKLAKLRLSVQKMKSGIAKNASNLNKHLSPRAGYSKNQAAARLAARKSASRSVFLDKIKKIKAANIQIAS